MKTCIAPGCGREVKRSRHGLCAAHYMRWRALGDLRADIPIKLKSETLEKIGGSIRYQRKLPRYKPPAITVIPGGQSYSI